MNRKSLIASAVASTFLMFGCLSGDDLADDQYDVNSTSRALAVDADGLMQPSLAAQPGMAEFTPALSVREVDLEEVDAGPVSCGNVVGWGVGCYGVAQDGLTALPAHYCDGDGPYAMDRHCPGDTVEDYVVIIGFEVNAARHLTEMQACPESCSLTIDSFTPTEFFTMEVEGDRFKCRAVHTAGSCTAE